jgi:nitrite reductase (NO-forming)
MADWVRTAGKDVGLNAKALFEDKATCINCHQADGREVAGVFPPLAGNRRVAEGDGSYVAKTIVHGRSGELTVRGHVFNAVMPPSGPGRA